jgi:hypothetical protein
LSDISLILMTFFMAIVHSSFSKSAFHVASSVQVYV